MINWNLVQLKLSEFSKEITFKEILNDLYLEQDIGLRGLERLSEHEASFMSFRSKLIELGIKMKKRGGAHFTKKINKKKKG